MVDELNRILESSSDATPTAFHWQRRLQVIRHELTRLQRQVQEQSAEHIAALAAKDSAVATANSLTHQLYDLRAKLKAIEIHHLEDVHQTRDQIKTLTEQRDLASASKDVLAQQLFELNTRFQDLNFRHMELLSCYRHLPMFHSIVCWTRRWRLFRLIARLLRRGFHSLNRVS